MLNEDLWGSSCEGSSAIAGESAHLLKIPGYRAEGSEEAKALARAYLRRVKSGKPTTRRLYSGHSRTFDARVGDVLRLPLIALSDDEDFARTFADGDAATMLYFEPGIRAMRYSDIEWITAGAFVVESIEAGADPFWKTPLTIVTLVAQGAGAKSRGWAKRAC